LPLTLTATFDPIGCPSVAGKTYTLTYDPALGYWKVLFPGGAYPNDVDGVFFQCTNATTNCFQLKVTFLSGFQMNPPSLNNADVCYPFKCSFPVMTADFGHPCAAINSSAVVTA
jgi:hypothetical protein